MTPLITPALVALDTPLGDGPEPAIRALAELVARAGRSTDPAGLAADALAREAKSATGMPGGLAIPHCRSAHVSEATLVFARPAPPVPFGAKDGAADLIFMIAAPADGDADHLKLLSKLARALVKPDFTAALRAAATQEEVVALVDGVLSPAPAPAAAPPAEEPTPAAGGKQVIVAVTACPTGIAHTYMAADALVAAGERAGVEVVVEPQGSTGTTPLDPAVIARASAAIFATDVGVRGKERFAGLPEVSAGVKAGVGDADALVARAIAAASDPNARRVRGEAGAGAAEGGAKGRSLGVKIRTALLTGVSYMIPFVAAGGLLIALGFLFAGYEITENGRAIALDNSLWDLPAGGLMEYLGAVMFSLGSLAFSFLVPALAGYIAFAIADRPGIAPGFTVGVVANEVGAGFIGGIVGGLLAGTVAYAIASRPVPRFVQGLMPVVIVPLLATLVAGGLMFMVLGAPLATATTELQDWLGGMSGSSAALLGVILGAMMCFDLGGPVNKAAYAFATAGLSVADPATLKIMAAVMLAGMVPPLALALASTLAPRQFTEPERENGRAAWLLGASFISEGAIPFAAADPLRIIPPVMLGGALTGALAMSAGVELSAPHGGIFVLFAVDGVGMFFVSLIAGTVLAAAAVVALKRLGRTAPAPESLTPAGVPAVTP